MTEMDIATGGAVVDSVARAGRAKRPLPSNCFACGAPVAGPFCHVCGQKNDDCRRSIFALAVDSIGDFIAFDGRVVRTVWSMLLRPGKHVREYGDGKRSPYSPPVRFFLVVTFVFFTTLWLTDTHMVSFRPYVTPDENGGEPSISVDGGFLTPSNDRPYTEEEMQALLDFVEAEGGEGNEISINGREYSADEVVGRILRVLEDPTSFNAALNDWVPRVMILMIPLLAVMGTIFIRGKDALIYDHLLLSLNTHSMAFLVLIFGLVTATVLPGTLFAGAFFIGVPIYYLVGLKGAFGRGWIKTFFAAFITMTIYWGVLMIAMSLSTFVSFMSAF